MTCSETRDLFSGLADDALTRAERTALDAHLAGCADCRRELAGLLRTVKLVRAIDPAHAPAGFVDRVLAAARPEPWPRRLARRLFVPWPKVPLEAAALLLIAGLAVLLFRGSPEQQQASRVETPAPGPAAPARSRELAPSETVAVPREVAPAPPPAAPAPPPAREFETAKNRVEPPAAGEKGAPTDSVEPKAPARDAAPPADAPGAMTERQAAAPPAVLEGRRAKIESSERGQAPATERFSAPAQDNREDAKKDTGEALGKLRQESAADRQRAAAVPAPVGAAAPAPPAAAKAQIQPMLQSAPLSRTGPMTGIPATPPDVTAQLRAVDTAAAERALIELAPRVGGRQTGRRIDGGRVVVELAVPRDAYAQFVREVAALGAVSIERQATERPVLAVAVTVSN